MRPAPAIPRPERTADGDRYESYVQRQDPAAPYEWNPPTFGDILVDLGLRVAEVAFAAAMFAAGEEIAYFFKKRRLYPRRPPYSRP